MIESAAYDLLKELVWEDAKKEGKEEEFERSVRKMLMRGFKPDDVAAFLEVDIDKVKRIVDSLAQPAA